MGEEERARQERMAAAQASETTSSVDGDAVEESKDAEMQETISSAASPTAMDLGLSEEEALLQQALAMSMNENEPTAAQESGDGTENDGKPAAAAGTAAASMETEEDDD